MIPATGSFVYGGDACNVGLTSGICHMDVGWRGDPRIHWIPSGCSLEMVFEVAFPSWRNRKTFLSRCILLFYILLR